MNAVVLAGGVRSGLEVPGSNLPRALWPFPHQPLIAHVLGFLRNSGCEGIAICANGKTKMIASQLSSGATPWANLHYSEDPLPRGPAGCLRDLQEWIGEETFLAIQGTAHYDFDLRAMVEEHRRTGAAITVGARCCSDDPSLLEPVGVYLVEPNTLSLIHSVGFQDFKEQFLPKVIAAGMMVRCHQIQGTATLIHSPSHYLAAIGDAIARATSHLPSGYLQHAPGVVVHHTAAIHPSARITGPAWISENAVVEEHSVLAGPVILAPGACVEGHALLHNAVLLQNATVSVAAELISTILAPNATHRAEPVRTEAFAPIEPPPPRFAAPLWDRVDRFFALFGTARSAT